MRNVAPESEAVGKLARLSESHACPGSFWASWYSGAMLVSLACPAMNDRTPRYMEKALSAIHQGLRPGEQVVLSYAVNQSQVTLTIRLEESLAPRVIGPILANYPQA